MSRLVHWRYLASELTYRWRRTALLVGGVALAATLVVMLDVLGRSFADVATVPFRNLGADLIVQRNAVQSAVPKEMGIMLPYSAQPITLDESGRFSENLRGGGWRGFCRPGNIRWRGLARRRLFSGW